MHSLIIIRGPAGVGKSTVSEIFAHKINGKCFHLHDTLIDLNIRYISGEQWIPLNKFLQAHKVLKPLITKALKNSDVVLEGNFYHKEALLDFTSEFKETKVFTLKSSLQTCIARDATRKGIGPDRVADVYKLTAKFNAGIAIDTEGKTAEEVAEEISLKI